MVIGSASAGVQQNPFEQDEQIPWPRFRLNWHISVMINMHSYLLDCEDGEGFCFLLGFHRRDNSAGESMPGLIGPTNDGRFLAVKIDYDAVELYEEGKYINRFKNKRSIYMPEDVYFPDEVWKKMGMEPIVFKAGTYNLTNQDGSYYIMFPLQ